MHTLPPLSEVLSTHQALKAYLGGTLGAGWASRVKAGVKLSGPVLPPWGQLDGQLGPMRATEYHRSVGGVDAQRASALFTFY